ncbi:UNVERIFIED_CONTAM: Hemicentin-1 [Gekko kuhli]
MPPVEIVPILGGDGEESPKLTVVKKELLIALGDTTVMECKTTGVPSPQVKWFKGDLELRASEYLIIDVHRGQLKIQETQDLDAGDYTCVATNDAGSASGKITLDVGSPPVFTQEPSDESMDIGSNVTLACYVHGYPDPKVKWQRVDGAPLFSRPFAVSSISQLRTGALSINNLWVNDEATYICEAENQFGKIVSRPATLTVTGLVTPLIGMSPAAANVIEGHQLTLPCVLLAGNPIPERKWIKNGVMLAQNPYISVRSDGSLHLERVRLQDSGDYMCMASNVAGTNNKTTTVSVFGERNVQGFYRVVLLLAIQRWDISRRREQAVLQVLLRMNDERELVRGELIPPSNPKFSAVSDGSLHVVSPGGEESGEYICTATNAAGYATRKVQLTVYGKEKLEPNVHKSLGHCHTRLPVKKHLIIEILLVLA